MWSSISDFSYPSDQCLHAIGIVSLQAVTGVVVEMLIAGIVIAKLSRPLQRAATLMFSRRAVVCLRDDQLCLLIRVGDTRKGRLTEVNIRLQLIKDHVTKEGELIQYQHIDLKVTSDKGNDNVSLVLCFASTYIFLLLISCLSPGQ